MVRIRMQRVGRPHKPHFRIVAIHGTKARDAASLEVIGHYHPEEKTEKIVVDTERLKYWISKGAQPSDTLRTILVTKGIWGQIQTAS
ncbi:MAG TPA: 30S ribosomal protein S16 [Elusimicrobiota bacterium]|nr:30S ribosomal protein S16 [Elusimicrobiota bacterium]